jgi:hypothetical protein
LKQLQLIQILRINPPRVAAAADVAAKVPGVNRLWQASECEKAASGMPVPPFGVDISGVLAGRRFTAR